jgi:hypothetical protein
MASRRSAPIGPDVTPIYDDAGNLTWWQGITFRDPNSRWYASKVADPGGRSSKVQSTFDVLTTCVESCRSSRVQVRLTRVFTTFYTSRIGSAVGHEHAAGAAAKGTFATSRTLGNVKSSKAATRGHQWPL